MLAHRISLHLYCKINLCQTLHYSSLYSEALPKLKSEAKKHIIHCNTQITKYGRNGKIEEAESVFRNIPTKNIVSWTAMLSAYAQNGQIKKALQVFDEMPQRNIASWNAIITAYMRNRGDMAEAFELFLRMPEKNGVSYAAMITGFANRGLFVEAMRLYCQTPREWREPVCSNALINGYLKMGQLDNAVKVFEGMEEKDVVSWSLMVDGYCKNGKLGDARELFEKMEEKNVVTWGCMIDGYMKMGFFNEGFELFWLMRKEGVVTIESTILTIVLEACGRHGRYLEACQIHGLNVCLGFDFDVFLGNAVITMYSRFGCVKEARKVYDAMNRKDVISSNSMIACFVQAEKFEEAYAIFETCPEKDVVTWTTIITGFARKGLMDKCVQLFKMMPGEKDDVAWTALISGFVNNGKHEDAIYWFIQMLANAVRPNPLTLSNVLSASASIATLNQGLQIHAVVCKFNMEFDISIQNSLISMYAKCGNVGDAYDIFNSIGMPNIVSFNSMIGGFAQNGLGKEAIKLFRKAQTQCDQFNEITFLGVLSACAYEGLVEEGWNYFKSMKDLFNIEPGPDHYACMVDLLGRAGLLDDAMNLIHSMPVKQHTGVWGALLAASRTHIRPDLAKLAAQHISGLEPDNAAPYVILSDIYSFTGKKRDEEQVRMAKNVKGIKKSPGCSWIMLSGEGSHANNLSEKSLARNQCA